MRALEERAELARKLCDQAKSTGHRLLAENWAAKRDEFEREMNFVRGSIRRMDRLAAQVDVERRSAAE